MKQEISVRPLETRDLADADRIVRLAFGTFLGLPDPSAFMGDADYVGTRFQADPTAAFAAERGTELVGSNFATSWGSFGFFGPLTIRPDLWDHGVGKRLMEPILGCFERWGTQHAGLFTFAQSPKHVGLYQHFGFWPRSLTAVLAKPVGAPSRTASFAGLSALPAGERSARIEECRQLTDSVAEGLDVGREIRAVAMQELGDTVLLQEDRLTGFAVCHCGPRTEAGSGTCYVKFGVARPGPGAERTFGRLLEACESFAAERGLLRLVAGVSLARRGAYRRLLEQDFRAELQGVTMHRPDEPGYDDPDVYVIDDWR